MESPLVRAALLASTLLPLAGCGGGEDAPEELPLELLLARERAAAHFAESEFGRSLDELRPLADVEGAAYEDLIHAACVALQPAVFDPDLAQGWVERAEVLEPDNPRTSWARFRLAKIDGEFEQALDWLRKVEAADPRDLPTLIAIGSLLDLLDSVEEARDYYLRVLDVGPDFGGSWYRTTAFRLQQLERQSGNDEEASRWRKEFDRLGAEGITIPTQDDFDRGTYGSVAPPPAEAHRARAEGLAGWDFGSELSEPAPGALGLFAATTGASVVEEKDKVGQSGSLGNTFRDEDAPPQELVRFGARGLELGRLAGDAWSWRTLHPGPVEAACGLDLGTGDADGGDGDLDLACATPAGLVLLVNDGGEFVAGEPLATFDGAVAALEAVDYDHEGDLDLLAVGEFGVRLFRNDAAHAAGGAFVDVTAEAGLPSGGAFAWCAVEDVDADNDVDLLLGGAGSAYLANNERGGRLSDASTRFPAALAAALAAGGARLADFDHDGRMDAWPAGADEHYFRGLLGGGFERADAGELGAPLAGDVALATTPRVAVLDADRAGAPVRVELEGADDATRLVTRRAAEGGPPAILLALRGGKDNRRGKGAVVELVYGPLYRRMYWSGEPTLIATHGLDALDVLRVSWPNGVVQSAVGVPGEGRFVLSQREGLVGSCPFLYSWNGETYEFISDVIGITPLGLPMGPGQLVPPDHDEYVLVRGDQLRPKDGMFELQFTEELREVTYLDRIRLDVVDHPTGTDIFPNERFTFPPFPEPHTHTVTDPLVPRRATGSDGGDWRAELAATDGEHAAPFRELRGQFLGLAEPHFLELEFDPELVRDAPRLRLVMTGWLYWTDASVNMASARHPEVEFVPPLLQVPDGAGWRTVEPPLGFPAGKTKTMVIDVTAHVDRADPRLRIFSTLSLYWDSILLAVDDDDAPLAVTSVEPAAAELWLRGFSKRVPYLGHEELDWFEWDELDDQPRWNQHPGLYTKLGACLPLLTAVDDMYVVMGAGDALTVRFPADGLPELPAGWTRDYLVFLDGWAKDRDPNSVEALFVEPLPFHGMSGYPYGDDESFPDDEEHRRWRAEWLTRPDHRWIEPLAPALKR
ncbi:MAG: FG-GAP-like repeat-containing protein [Planctomycetota bacterium]